MSGQSAEARTAAMFTHEGYRYTVVMIANGALPKTTEAELWYYPPGAQANGSTWKYFGRRSAGGPAEARDQVERDFKASVDAQAEANTGDQDLGPPPAAPDRCRRCGKPLTRNDLEDDPPL